MKKLVDQILARLRDQGVEVAADDIEKRLQRLIVTFNVPENEARRSVEFYFLKEHGIMPTTTFFKRGELVKVAEIKVPGHWVDLEVKVLDLWEPASDAISQTGLVGDETGLIKFVKWAKSDLPDMEEGQSYRIKNVVTDEYQGRFSVKLNRSSEIIKLEKDVKVVEAASLAPVEELKVADISEPDRWIDLKAKVVQLWDPTSEAISQTGLVGDETGVIKFVKWTKSGLPDMEEGQSYFFKNVVTDKYQDMFSVKLNSTSEIKRLDEEIEVVAQSTEFSGAIVNIQKGSGLIKRCPICRRALTKGVCGEHGKVEGIYDMRIKAVLDNGSEVQEVLINRDTTERLIGLTLEDAKEMAIEALDNEVVKGLIEEKLLGRYYAVEGPSVGRYILAETIDKVPPVNEDEVAKLILESEEVI
ncbi:MAG: replication protein A [Methanotrichaceae archaeon]